MQESKYKIETTDVVLISVGICLFESSGANNCVIDGSEDEVDLTLEAVVHVQTFGAVFGAADRFIVG